MDEDRKWGFIDKTGKVIIPCRWRDAEDFNIGQAIVQDDDNYMRIDKMGRCIENEKITKPRRSRRV